MTPKNKRIKNMKSDLLGAHLSIAGGIFKVIERAKSINATAIQIFVKNSRSWSAKPLSKEETEKFIQAKKTSNVEFVVAHSSYLINIASTNEKTEALSCKALFEELERCEQLKIPYLVLHPGSHLGSGEKEGIKRVAKNINSILKKFKGKTKILLETMAGQGTNIGYTFEQIKAIRDLIEEKSRVGVCLDTCHVYAAGYDIATEKGLNNTLKSFDKIIGFF